jgi:hypothetical protein
MQLMGYSASYRALPVLALGAQVELALQIRLLSRSAANMYTYTDANGVLPRDVLSNFSYGSYFLEAGIPSSGLTIPLKLTDQMNGPHRKHLMITDRDKGIAPKGKPSKAQCFCLCLLHSFLEHDPKVST